MQAVVLAGGRTPMIVAQLRWAFADMAEERSGRSPNTWFGSM
jgi:hypothetical protein